MSVAPTSPNPFSSLMQQIKQKKDAEGFIDISPVLQMPQINSLGSLKNLLPTKINIDTSFEVQQIKLDSYAIYDQDNILSQISINNFTGAVLQVDFNLYMGFPNAQEIHRKAVLLEDIKNNPTLTLEDLNTIREYSSTIMKTLAPLRDQILTLHIKDNTTGASKVITQNNINDVKDVILTEDLQKIISFINELKIKYNDTNSYNLYSKIENLPVTAGGLAINPVKGTGIDPKEYAKLVNFDKNINISLSGTPSLGDPNIFITSSPTSSSTSSPTPPPVTKGPANYQPKYPSASTSTGKPMVNMQKQ